MEDEGLERILESEVAALEALKKCKMNSNTIKAQEKRIEYVKSFNPTQAPLIEFDLTFMLADTPITPDKVAWKLKLLKRKTLIERQYVEAAARLDMAYTGLDEKSGVRDEDRMRVESSLLEAKQRHAILSKALQKWSSLPQVTISEEEADEPSQDSVGKFWGKIEMEIEHMDDYLLRAVTDKESQIYSGGKFSIKCEGDAELELQYLDKRTKNLQAIAFLPLAPMNHLKSFTGELEMEPNSTLSIKLKFKPRPASRIERHPAIIRKTINGHQLETAKTFTLKKCYGCGDFCFSRCEGVSCTGCRVFSHRKCTPLLPSRCLAPSDTPTHQRTTSESDILTVDYRKHADNGVPADVVRPLRHADSLWGQVRGQV